MAPAGAPDARRRGAHWGWFAGILGLLAVLGISVAVAAMLPLAMATDPCYTGNPDRICHLSAAGQNLLMLIPWLALFVGFGVTGTAAALLTHWHRSPLFAIPVGIIGYLATLPLSFQLAFVI